MKKRLIKSIIIVLTVILVLYIGLKITASMVFTDSPSKIVYEREKIRDYNEQISFLFNLSNKFSVSEIGTVTSPIYPDYKLYKIQYGNYKNENAKNYLFISGVHGHEPATVYAIREFILYLDTMELLENITIDFMYILNPYGFEHNYLYSSSHVNIDRDYIRLKTQEINIFLNSIKGKKYSAVYDFHEDNSNSAIGCYMFFYKNRNKEKALNMLEMLRRNNVPINNEYEFIGLKAEYGALYVPYYAKFVFMHLGRNAGAGLFFDSINTEEVFVFETPTKLDLEKRVNIHLMLLKYIIGI